MSKASRKILKEYKIKTCCKPLGRLPKEPRSLEHLEKITKAIGERNEAKCSFGTDKKKLSSLHKSQVSPNCSMQDKNMLLC